MVLSSSAIKALRGEKVCYILVSSAKTCWSLLKSKKTLFKIMFLSTRLFVSISLFSYKKTLSSFSSPNWFYLSYILKSIFLTVSKLDDEIRRIFLMSCMNLFYMLFEVISSYELWIISKSLMRSGPIKLLRFWIFSRKSILLLTSGRCWITSRSWPMLPKIRAGLVAVNLFCKDDWLSFFLPGNKPYCFNIDSHILGTLECLK